MLANRVSGLPDGRRPGSSNRSGTASAPSSSATATSSSSRAATRSRSTAISRSSSRRSRRSCPSAASSTARSSSRASGGLDFEALQLRLHPAASRVKLLSEQIPASVVFFDLLCRRQARPLRACRSASGARSWSRCSRTSTPPLHITPATRDRDVAADWFSPLRGRRPRRRRSRKREHQVRAEQACHVQGQTRARMRLRRRGVPLAQGQRPDGGRFPAARAL